MVKGTVRKSPPILGGVEAREGFGGGKGRLKAAMGANRHDRPPLEGLNGLHSPPDPGGEFFTASPLQKGNLCHGGGQDRTQPLLGLLVSRP